MRDTYRGGYKRALLDLLNYIEDPNGSPLSLCRGKHEIREMLTSLLHLLLEDPEMLDIFLDYGGSCTYKITPEKKVVEVFRGRRRRSKSPEEKEMLQDRSEW